MQATFIVWFHTARKNNLLQTIHFLQKWHKINDYELITICQDSLNFEIPIQGWKNYQHFDLNIKELHHAYTVNFAVDKSKSDKIVVLESDRILPQNYFCEVINQLEIGTQITTKTMKKLTKEVSNNEIEKDSFEYKLEHRTLNNEICARGMWSGNTAFMKADFYKYGKIDEKYIGYGFTDSDMSLTTEKAKIQSIYRDEIEIHLWHPSLTYGKADQKLQFIKNGLWFCKKWSQPVPEFLKREINQYKSNII